MNKLMDKFNLDLSLGGKTASLWGCLGGRKFDFPNGKSNFLPPNTPQSSHRRWRDIN